MEQNDDLLRFKKLLEYFVCHLNYMDNKSNQVTGYEEYIKPLLDSNNFIQTGQGYNGDSIQKQIQEWGTYNNKQVFINIQPNFGNYRSKKCYLNWAGTGINIFYNWDSSELEIGYGYWWLNPTKYKEICHKTLDELGLFKGEDVLPKTLNDFFERYIDEYTQYLEQRGDYYTAKHNHDIIDQHKIIDDSKQMLIYNYNLILNGAPGTGKTFLAKQIAEEMILGCEYDENNDIHKAKMDEQFDFVQFHPSFDYTDFVEGLRPVQDDKGNIGFKREDGIFMAFCRKALKAYNAVEKKDDAPKYIFVIDEINRGELSKIFGELFFSIDPGYRGSKGEVTTQYANLWTDDFDKSRRFYVPENVYIIGTMNDIDRSVESMDFAMRRRFTFQEIKAKDRQDAILGSNQAAKDCMKRLNDAIVGEIPGLNESYHIGPAYFKDYSKGPQSLWENKIKGLLYEYLRGMPNAKDLIQKLENAFFDKKNITNGNNPANGDGTSEGEGQQ